MTTIPKIWIYALVGYSTDFRSFKEEFNKKLSEFESNGSINIMDTSTNIWEWVGNNCYGNYDKDEAVLANFQNIIINYDEMNNLVTVQVYACSDKYKGNNEEFFAKEILVAAADLLSEPDHWIVAFGDGSSRKPLNYFVKRVSTPATVEDFTVNEEMYGSKTDRFDKQLPVIEGYKSMQELISESGESLASSLEISTNDVQEVIKNIMETIKAEGMHSIESIQDPYKFFEIEFKPINPTISLVRDAGIYMTSLKCFNSTKIYEKVPESTFETRPPRSNHPTISIVYSRDNVDFIKTSCEIEKEVLGEEIENQLKSSTIETVDDFFSD